MFSSERLCSALVKGMCIHFRSARAVRIARSTAYQTGLAERTDEGMQSPKSASGHAMWSGEVPSPSWWEHVLSDLSALPQQREYALEYLPQPELCRLFARTGANWRGYLVSPSPAKVAWFAAAIRDIAEKRCEEVDQSNASAKGKPPLAELEKSLAGKHRCLAGWVMPSKPKRQ